MSRSNLIRSGSQAIAAAVILSTLFASGVATGVYFYPQMFPAQQNSGHSGHDHSQEAADGHDDHTNVIVLSELACDNMQLDVGTPQIGEYWKSILVPGNVVEIPGRSDLSVAAPVEGVVESVSVVPGQSLSAGMAMFKIRLTDEQLIDAQSSYVDTLTRQQVAQQEIDRLTPLIASGAVSGVKKRDLEYELKQLKAQEARLLQELRGRGLPESLISELREKQTFATTLTVFPPSYVSSDSRATQDSSGYSLEDLMVHPGKRVLRGQSLCSVAYHSMLYIEGTAFEDDLSVLQKLIDNDWAIAAEMQHTSDCCDHAHETLKCKLLRIDNHVDEATQTVRFFIELENSVVQKRDDQGHRFEQWRYRPGQRLHLRLPVERWENQLTLPSDAVIFDGPNVFVFAEHIHGDLSAMPPELPLDVIIEDGPEIETEDDSSIDVTGLELPVVESAPSQDDHAGHDHAGHDHAGHDHAEGGLEFELVPVRMLHRDDKTVVIANDGRIGTESHIALNNAYKLYLSMKMQSAGGGGHHHGHAH